MTRLALIGAGWIAETHIGSLAQLPDAEVVAVADIDVERARSTAQQTGARPYEDWARLLDDRSELGLDAVLVCTPPQHHRDPTLAALDHGLPVYLEKPVARTLEDAAAIVEAVQRTGTLCAIGYQWHSLAGVQRIRTELAGQRLGLLVGRVLGPAMTRPWVMRRAEGGGQLLERASHQIDLQRLIAGEVVSVQTHAGSAALADHGGVPGDIEDVLSLELRFASGASGAIHVAWLRSGIPGIFDLTVAASEALMTLRLDPDFALTGSSRGQPVEQREERRPALEAMARFVGAVRAGELDSRLCTARDAAATLAVAIACERSLESGARVDVGP